MIVKFMVWLIDENICKDGDYGNDEKFCKLAVLFVFLYFSISLLIFLAFFLLFIASFSFPLSFFSILSLSLSLFTFSISIFL